METNAKNQPKAPVTKKRKKKNIALFSVLGVLALLLILGLVLYFVWYQNPRKVVGDMMSNALWSKAPAKYNMTSTVTSKDATIKLTGQGAGAMLTGSQVNMKADISVKVQGQPINAALNVDTVIDKDLNLYMKLKDARQTATKIEDAFFETSPEMKSLTPEQKVEARKMVASYVDPIVNKLDNQWVKVTKDDLKQIDPKLEKLQPCIAETANMFVNDGEVKNQLTSAYTKNEFVKVEKELGNKNGSIGYTLGIDKEKAKKFSEATKDSKIAKKVQECVEQMGGSSDRTSKNMKDQADDATSEVNVWVDQWSHKLTRVEMTVKSKDGSTTTKTEQNISYSSVPAVTVPSDARPASEVAKEIQTALPKTQ